MTVLSQFMAAINHGQRWTICKYMEQQMWRPEWGGWRARPDEVAVGGAQSAGANGGDPGLAHCSVRQARSVKTANPP